MSDVAIIMGSDSDWPTMQEAANVLDDLGISHSVDVVSAHRMPLEMVEFSQSAQAKGYKVIIAGAGGCSTFTWNGRIINYSSSNWSSNCIKESGRNGFPSFNSTNACRGSCCNSWC